MLIILINIFLNNKIIYFKKKNRKIYKKKIYSCLLHLEHTMPGVNSVIYTTERNHSRRVQQGKNIVREHLKSVLSSREIESLISAILRKTDELVLSSREIESIISVFLRKTDSTLMNSSILIRQVKIDEFINELQKIALRFNELMTDEQGMFKLIFMDDREDNEYNRKAYFFLLFKELNDAVIDKYF